MDAAFEGDPLTTVARRKIVYVLLSLLVLYVLVRSLAGAATTGFWFDEIITSALSSQPSMKAVRAALATGVDGQPPGFYLVERATATVVKNREIAMRLPSVLAFPCTLVCVFMYTKKRSGEIIAFLCTLLLLSTILFQRYATEARPYSLMVACFAFALVCYQRVPSRFWTIAFGVALVIAQCFHHYSVFAMIPFGLAETVVQVTTRKFRWGVWLALICGASPLLFFWSLLAQLKAYLGAHFQITYSYSSIPSTFGDFFLVDSPYGAGLAALVLAGVISFFFWRPRFDGVAHSGSTDLIEGTLLLSLVCLPVIAFTIVKMMHGAMRSPYLMVTVLGVCLATACVLSQVRKMGVMLFAVFLIFSVGLREYRFWRSTHSFHLMTPTLEFEKFLEGTVYANTALPIVVTSGMTYTPMAYYASGPMAKRLVYLTDVAKELRFQGTDTMDKNVTLLQKYTPLQIRDYEEFIAVHPVFLMYGEEPDGYGNMWLTQEIGREQYFVQSIAVDGIRRLFLVDTRVKGQKSTPLASKSGPIQAQ